MFKVVIVDDEKMIKHSLRKLIEDSGERFRVSGEAANGREALNLMVADPPHLLITDICMPVMDGLELIAEVKRQFRQTEIVVISGYSEFNYAQQALRYNVTDYLLKPIHPGEIKQLLQNICEQHDRKKQIITDRQEYLWKYIEQGDQIVDWIWTLQENRLEEELAAMHAKFEENGIRSELLSQIYSDQLAYIIRKLEEKSGRSFKEVYPMEHSPEILKGQLHEKFRAGCMGLVEDMVRHRNWGRFQQIKKAVEFLRTNYVDSSLSLNDAAELASVSVTYFSRLFKEETGMNFIKYMTDLRMGHAKILLTQPEIKVCDVAVIVGYTNYHHFAKAFKKRCGITPTEFRKIQRYI